MSSYDFHFPYISVFFDLKSGSRFYKVEVKNILLVKKIEFDAKSNNNIALCCSLTFVPSLFQSRIEI